LTDDGMKQVGIENLAGFTEGTERDASATKKALHLVEFARLLNAPQTFDDGIEEEQQEQARILVVEQSPIASAVTSGGIVPQTVQQRTENLEVLEPLQVLGFDRCSSLDGHGLSPEPCCHNDSNSTEFRLRRGIQLVSCRSEQKMGRQTKIRTRRPPSKTSAGHYWDWLHFSPRSQRLEPKIARRKMVPVPFFHPS